MRKIIGAAILMWIVGSCTKPQDLEFVDVQNIRMVQWGLSESLVGLDVRFYNPNNRQVKLKDANVKVYANSTYLGDTQMDTTVSVPRKDTFAIPLTMKVKTVTAISKLVQSLQDSMVNVKVEGSVKMGKAGVFINYPIRYESLQKLSDLNF
jgi:LEA14-like dessication related protein